MDNDIKLLVSIFQDRFVTNEHISNHVKYAERYKNEIQDAGPELQFLQLATPDNYSPLGWTPTPYLMQCIREHQAGKKASEAHGKRLYFVDDMYELMNDLLGRSGFFSPYTNAVLTSAGLVREFRDNVDELGSATPHLHMLFMEGYHARKMRSAKEPKVDPAN